MPQGSVPGPLLFLVYVNDIPSIVECYAKLFADDTKIYGQVSAPTVAVFLQADIDALVAWSDRWQLPFNEGKCKVLHLGSGNSHLQYAMRGVKLAETDVEQDLGIHIDTSLKFRKQAAAVTAKANQVLAVIKRSFEMTDTCTLPLLYKALVGPHLELGNVIWGPFNRAD